MIPWNAIATISGDDSRRIAIVDSPRELVLVRRTNERNASDSILLAGISDFGRSGLPPLAGALAEVSDIESIARTIPQKIELLTEQKASKEAIKLALPLVSLAHIATHGFSRSNDSTAKKEAVLAEKDPLLECGLYFALPPDWQSGNSTLQNVLPIILTAEEIVGLDSEFVQACQPSSACQTGLGRSLSGQGLIGLRSAFPGSRGGICPDVFVERERFVHP